MAIANAITWISTGVPPVSPDGTSLEFESRIATAKFGDGYISRTPIGINNITQHYTLAYNLLTDAESQTLYNFVKPLISNGATVYVPNYFKNSDGSVSEYFMVDSASPSTNDNLFNWTINLIEVFA